MLDLADYRRERDELLEIISRLAIRTECSDTVVDIGGTQENVGHVLEIVASRLASRTFRVLVAGEFNAGKSFFINTLLGEWTRRPTSPAKWDGLLSVDILPATTLLTEIVAGDATKAMLHLRNGDVIDLPLEDIANITSLKSFTLGQSLQSKLRDMPLFDRANPVERAQVIAKWLYETVDRVTISTPSQLLRAGITIVDSPGLGAIYEEHRLVTMSEMRVSDCIIFLLDSGATLSRTAEEFLLDASQYVGSFFFVQTKIDQRSPENVELVAKYNIQRLRSIAGEAIEIPYFPVSAKLHRDNAPEPMNEGGFSSLSAALDVFLTRKTGQRYLDQERRLLTLVLTALIDRETGRRANAAISSAQVAHRKSEREARLALCLSANDRVGALVRSASAEIASEMKNAREPIAADLIAAMRRGVEQLGFFERLFGEDKKVLTEIRLAANSIVFDKHRPRIERRFRELLEDVKSHLDVSMQRWLTPMLPAFGIPSPPQAGVSMFDRLFKNYDTMLSPVLHQYTENVVSSVIATVHECAGEIVDAFSAALHNEMLAVKREIADLDERLTLVRHQVANEQAVSRASQLEYESLLREVTGS